MTRSSTVSSAARLARQSWRQATRTRRLLPDYLVIGAQKAGTTSLHEWLTQHPAVGRPMTKEVHYFDLRAQQPLSWYRAHFPTRREAARLRRRLGTDLLCGEATPYYLFHPAAPERIRAVLPEIRLIVLLRDPAERAFSHHNHERVHGWERLSFAEAVAREDERLAGEIKRIRNDPYRRSFNHQHYSYLARGRYAEQLERWLAVFPRGQLLVLGSERLFSRPAATLAEVQQWLGLAPEMPARLKAENVLRCEPLDPSIRTELRDRLADDTVRLEALVGERFPWA